MTRPICVVISTISGHCSGHCWGHCWPATTDQTKSSQKSLKCKPLGMLAANHRNYCSNNRAGPQRRCQHRPSRFVLYVVQRSPQRATRQMRLSTIGPLHKCDCRRSGHFPTCAKMAKDLVCPSRNVRAICEQPASQLTDRKSGFSKIISNKVCCNYLTNMFEANKLNTI